MHTPIPPWSLVPSCDSAGVLGSSQPSLVTYVREGEIYWYLKTLDLASGKRGREEGCRVQLWGDFEVDAFLDS